MKVFIKIIFKFILFSSLIKFISSGYGVADKNETETETETEISPCLLTQPLKDIKDDCYDENDKKNDRKKCCYVEVKFKYNTFVSCYPVDLESDNIRDVIAYLKEEYKVDSKSIKIDCYNSFIKISLILVILIFII